jgi:hypothetical protein
VLNWNPCSLIFECRLFAGQCRQETIGTPINLLKISEAGVLRRFSHGFPNKFAMVGIEAGFRSRVSHDSSRPRNFNSMQSGPGRLQFKAVKNWHGSAAPGPPEEVLLDWLLP